MTLELSFSEYIKKCTQDIKLPSDQKNPSSSMCVSQLRVQKSKKQKFPLAVGLKQETTQKPSAEEAGSPQFPGTEWTFHRKHFWVQPESVPIPLCWNKGSMSSWVVCFAGE